MKIPAETGHRETVAAVRDELMRRTPPTPHREVAVEYAVGAVALGVLTVRAEIDRVAERFARLDFEDRRAAFALPGWRRFRDLVDVDRRIALDALGAVEASWIVDFGLDPAPLGWLRQWLTDALAWPETLQGGLT